jgi:hypothetical protein
LANPFVEHLDRIALENNVTVVEHVVKENVHFHVEVLVLKYHFLSLNF